jgi:2,3,4,5-tetrahydropyridine-2-carboxylate N-succinyltransferase
VIAPGVILSKAVQIYDVVNNCLLDRGADVPENAVVVPGSRKIKSEQSIVKEYHLSLSCPIIIKYRDAKTNAALTLEEALR